MKSYRIAVNTQQPLADQAVNMHCASCTPASPRSGFAPLQPRHSLTPQQCVFCKGRSSLHVPVQPMLRHSRQPRTTSRAPTVIVTASGPTLLLAGAPLAVRRGIPDKQRRESFHYQQSRFIAGSALTSSSPLASKPPQSSSYPLQTSCS